MEVRGQNVQAGGCADQKQQESGGDYEILSNCSGDAGSDFFGSLGLSLKNNVSYLPESSQDVSVRGSSRHTFSTVWDKLAVDYDNISYSLRGGKQI
jgi:hypothetical protein